MDDDDAQYRSNTLALVRRLKERGAFPAVTIANPPYTGGEAAQWWRDLAASALLIRQVFFTCRTCRSCTREAGASRAMRSGMRALVRRFTEIGIPASRVALVLQFHAPGRAAARAAAAREVARDREAAGAAPARDEGAQDTLDLVVGLGDLQPGGDRPGQGRGRLRLPLGARPASAAARRRRPA